MQWKCIQWSFDELPVDVKSDPGVCMPSITLSSSQIIRQIRYQFYRLSIALKSPVNPNGQYMCMECHYPKWTTYQTYLELVIYPLISLYRDSDLQGKKAEKKQTPSTSSHSGASYL
jgi:hypothetical protein